MTALAAERPSTTEAPGRRWPARLLTGVALAVAAVGLFAGYLTMARSMPVDSDGASQALQAWDLLHGNVFLRGWTVSDVPFYTNELLVLAAVEAFRGLSADVVPIGAALLYTLLTLGVAVLARGRSRGREAVARVTVALAVMAVPMAGLGTFVLLGSPDHTGTAAPLLLALIVLDRWPDRRFTPYVVGVVLTVGEISDPLMLYVGALPLAVVCAARQWRDGERRPWRWRGGAARLVVASAASVVASRVVLRLLELGGLHVHAVPAGLAAPTRWGHNLWLTVVGLSADFGAYFPERRPGWDTAMGAAKLVALVATIAALVVLAVRVLRRNGSRTVALVDQVLVVAVVVNLGAFAASTIPTDPVSARQITPVLFLGAAASGRLVGPLLAPRRWLPAVVAGLVLVYGGEFVARLGVRPAAPADQDVAVFLRDHGLTYGLGGFWTANGITLQTGGAVHVAPVVGRDGVYAYRWLSTVDWYDPARHDARFVVIRPDTPVYGTEAGTRAQFGAPTRRYEVGRAVIYVYDRNLLIGLPAMCLPEVRPSMAQC